jgi:uncharacterized protein YukE
MPDPTGVRLQVPVDLGDSGPTIIAIANNIDDELQRLASRVEQLSVVWDGRAKDQWHGYQAQWDGAAKSLMGSAGSLGSLGTTQVLVSDNFNDCEQQNIANWNHT